MNVAQNIFLGRFPRINGLLLDHKKMHADASRLLKSLYLDMDTTANAITLGTGQQQMVEIAKALSMNSKVLIMDEPTASLTETEIEHLFKIIRTLKKNGIGIIYISHRLQEVKEIGDRVTVLRDGKFIGTKDVKDVEIADLVKMMVGRNIEDMFERTYQPRGEEALRVEDLGCGKRLKGACLNLHCGEIVGLAGLVGAGRTELARAIFGVDKYETGKVIVFGKEMHPNSPAQMVDAGISLLPEDRKNQGLCLILPTSDNVVMASLKNYSRILWLTVVRKRLWLWITLKNYALPHLHQNASSNSCPAVLSKKWFWPSGYALKQKSLSLMNLHAGLM